MSQWVTGPGSYGWLMTEDGPTDALLALFEAILIEGPAATVWLPEAVAYAAVRMAGSYSDEGYDVAWRITRDEVAWCGPLDERWTVCPVRVIEDVKCLGLPRVDFWPCDETHRAHELVSRGSIAARLRLSQEPQPF